MARRSSNNGVPKRKPKKHKDYYKNYRIQENIDFEKGIRNINKTLRNPNRTYQHVELLYEDLKDNPILRESVVSELGQLQSMIDDREQVQRTLYLIAKNAPNLEKQVQRLRNQLSLLAQMKLDEDEITKAQLENLKKISIELKKSTKAIQDYIDQDSEIAHKGLFKGVIKLREQIISTFDEHIFKEGTENWKKYIKQYAKPEYQELVADIQDQQNQVVATKDLNNAQRDVMKVFQWAFGDIENKKAMEVIDRAHQQQILKESNEPNSMQEIGRWLREGGLEGDIKRERQRKIQDRNRRRRDKLWSEKEIKKATQEQSSKMMLDEFQALVAQQAIAGQGGINANNVQFNIIPPQFVEILTDDQIDYINKKYFALVNKILENRQIAEALKYISKFISIGDSVFRYLASFGKGQHSLGKQAQQMFSDICSPIQWLVSTLGVQQTAVGVAHDQFSTLLNMVQEPIYMLSDTYSNDKKKKQKEGKKDKKLPQDDLDSSRRQMIGSAVTLLVNMVSVAFKAVQLSFQVAQMAISTGIELFISILQFHLKLLKEIAKTSQVVKAVSNIFSLAITMFFMPFMNVFANQLLEHVFDLLNWQRSFNSVLNSSWMVGIFEQQDTVIQYFEQNKELLKSITVKFIDEFLPIVLDVAKRVMIFVGYFTEALLDNYNTHLEPMLKQGIEAQNQLIENNIIKLFMRFGISVAEFIKDDGEYIKSALDFAGSRLIFILDCIGFVMEHMQLLMMALGAQIQVQITTACIASYLGGMMMLPLLMSMIGIGSVVIVDQLQQGVGALIGWGIYELFFNNAPQFQKGGYIPAVNGGMFVIVAEKETELIIPESKIHMIRGHNNLIIDVNGDVYGMDNPKSEIMQAIDTQQNYQRFR